MRNPFLIAAMFTSSLSGAMSHRPDYLGVAYSNQAGLGCWRDHPDMIV
jgi:hypothetical protein